MTTPTTARRANAQIRRLRAALEQARGVIGVDLGKLEMTVITRHCLVCNSTGDVLGLWGEWRGRCTCPAGRALKPWTPTDVRRNDPPCDHSERIDVKFRDGHIVRDCLPNSWAWGEAGNTTITYWRLSV